MDPLIFSLIAVLLISLISLIGAGAFAVNTELLKKSVFVLIALAAGALLGDAFIHLIPEAFEEAPDPTVAALSVLAGIFIFFVLEKYLHWHHSHGEIEYSGEEHSHVHPVGTLVIVSDALHNLIDGVAIGTAFLINPAIGIATTIAVALHEIPQEIADFGMLIHAGYSRIKALLFNFASALTAFVGVGVAFMIGERFETLLPYLGAFAAGNFIYIALADIVPELHKETGKKRGMLQLGAVLVGVALMVLLLQVEAPGTH